MPALEQSRATNKLDVTLFVFFSGSVVAVGVDLK